MPLMPKEFLSFRLGGEEYGIDILRVQEIRSYEAPSHMANAPCFIKGVLHLQGGNRARRRAATEVRLRVGGIHGRHCRHSAER
jgi:hypothetical protein